jgi:hypothetical protein
MRAATNVRFKLAHGGSGAKNCVFVRVRLLRTNVLPLALDSEDSFQG